MTAYDLDGTLCTETPARWWEKPLFWIFGDAWGRVRKTWEKPILKPEGEYVIITSRVDIGIHKQRTAKWLVKNGYTPALVSMITVEMKNNMFLSEYKALGCKVLEVTKYFENDPKIAEYLRQEVPGLEVVEV